MTKISLSVLPRTAKGRANRPLRSDGLIPGVVYGKGVESLSVQAKLTELKRVYLKSGETQVIDLQVEGEKTVRPVLISELSFNPVKGIISHFDLRQVNLKEKIVAQVPVELIGESPAVKEFGADVVLLLNEIQVEALPNDLPESISIDLTKLAQVGDHLKISDLISTSHGYEIQADPETVVVTVSVKEVEEEVVSPAAATEAAPEAATTTPAQS